MAVRVLHLIKSLGRGGAEMLLVETLKLHRREFFEFHVGYFLPWKDQMVSGLKSRGAIVHCFAASNNVAMLAMTARVAEYVEAQNIDLVHCHLPWAGFVGRLLSRFWRIPVIYTEHNIQERYHGITFTVNKYTFNAQKAAIAVSNDVAESIQRRIGPKIPVRIIHNGVDTDKFVRKRSAGLKVRERLGIPAESVVVGNLAVFRTQKRLKEWLDVFASVAEKHPRLFGILVGDGPMKGEIESYRAESGLNDRVFLPGLQTDVQPWYSAMDVFMITSEFEGLPLALLEAMSMECAVCTTDAGGIKEVVQHRINGLMRGTVNWRQLSPDLDELVRDAALRRELATAGRKQICAKYSLRRMVDDLEDMYRDASGARME